MSGIDDYMFHCDEEDEAWERQRWRDELELARQSQQILYEAEHRKARLSLGHRAPGYLPTRKMPDGNV